MRMVFCRARVRWPVAGGFLILLDPMGWSDRRGTIRTLIESGAPNRGRGRAGRTARVRRRADRWKGPRVRHRGGGSGRRAPSRAGAAGEGVTARRTARTGEVLNVSLNIAQRQHDGGRTIS